MQETRETKNFVIVFDGDLHQINANTFLNSLCHTTTILNEANVELNREFSTNKKLEIKINSLEKGSFQVNIELISSFAEVIDELFSGEAVAYAAAIGTILTSVISIKKFLKGEKPKKLVETEDEFVITNNSNSNINVDKRMYYIYANNSKLNQALSKNFEALHEDESISGFKIEEKSEDQNHKITEVRREEFKDLAKRNMLTDGSQDTVFDSDAKLNIIKLAFEDNFKWTFYYKGNKISASLLDNEFHSRIDTGDELFAKGDILVCELQINKVFDQNVNTFVNKSYQVNKVKRHIPRNEQQNLDL